MRHEIALTTVALLLAGCGGGDHADGQQQPVEYFWPCDEGPAGLLVRATDESYRAIVDKEAAGGFVTDAAQAATLMVPAPGATVSAATPPMVTLKLPVMGRLWRRGFWSRALAFLAPIGTAYAHCGAVNGDNFLFRLTPQTGGAPAYTALLSVTSFQPSAEAWKKTMGGRSGQVMTVTVARAVLAGGRVAAGPFVSPETITLTVGP